MALGLGCYASRNETHGCFTHASLDTCKKRERATVSKHARILEGSYGQLRVGSGGDEVHLDQGMDVGVRELCRMARPGQRRHGPAEKVGERGGHL